MATRPLPSYRFQPVPPPDAPRANTPQAMAPKVILDGLNGMKRGVQGDLIPEPVVGRGVVSGRRYTFGERGPEGVVPANLLPDFLRRRGGTGSYALGGEIGYDASPYGGDDPYGGPVYDRPSPSTDSYEAPTVDPGATSGSMPTFGKGPGGIVRPLDSDPYSVGSYAQTDPNPAPHGSTNLPWSDPLAPSLPSTSTGSTPTGAMPSAPVTTPSPFTLTPQQQADIQRQIAETAARNRQQTTTAPPAGEDPAIRARREAEERARREAERLRGVQQPIQLPQGPTTAMPVAYGPSNLPTYREVAGAGTFGRSIPSARPQFLPSEDHQGETALQALLAAGALPPFLARVIGQQNGVHSVGTNRPQAYSLPSDVPLISRLAYEQMLPTERAAFESFISSYGLEPSDYWAYVEQVGPQGGPAPFSPLFGTRFQPFRQ